MSRKWLISFQKWWRLLYSFSVYFENISIKHYTSQKKISNAKIVHEKLHVKKIQTIFKRPNRIILASSNPQNFLGLRTPKRKQVSVTRWNSWKQHFRGGILRGWLGVWHVRGGTNHGEASKTTSGIGHIASLSEAGIHGFFPPCLSLIKQTPSIL